MIKPAGKYVLAVKVRHSMYCEDNIISIDYRYNISELMYYR